MGRMAETLTAPGMPTGTGRMAARLWPTDWLFLAYLAGIGVLMLACWSRVPEAWWLLILHAAGALLIVAAVKSPASRLAWSFRHWYPVPYVAACYREMSILIPALRGADFDQAMAQADYAIWGTHPTVWLERLQHHC